MTDNIVDISQEKKGRKSKADAAIVTVEGAIDALKDDKTDKTGRKAWQFKPGQPSANPAGRPKGSRNKLSELFISEMCADFMENGTDVIKRVRTEDPSAYAKIIASILPKQVEVSEVGAFGDMSEQQLDEFIALASRKLRDQSVAGHA